MATDITEIKDNLNHDNYYDDQNFPKFRLYGEIK